MYSVIEIKQDVERMVDCNVSAHFMGALNEASRKLLNRIDPETTKRVEFLETSLYDKVDRYVPPSDLKDKKVIDVRGLQCRDYRTSFFQHIERTFDKYKPVNSFAITHENGRKQMLVQGGCCEPHTLIHELDDLSLNGTWNTSGNVTNLRTDRLNYLTGNASFRFDANASGVEGSLYVTGMKNVDISEYVQTGSVFVWMDIPKPHSVQTIELQFGSSPVDYYSYRVTTAHNSTNFTRGWNLLRFALDGMEVVGTPIQSAISMAKVVVETDGTAIYDMRLDSMVLRNGCMYTVRYYSNSLFRDAVTDSWKEKATSEDDVINLDTVSYNLLLLETCKIVARDTKSDLAKYSVFQSELEKEYKDYSRTNQSEYIPITETYYKDWGRGRVRNAKISTHVYGNSGPWNGSNSHNP